MSLSTMFMDDDQREQYFQLRMFAVVAGTLLVSAWLSWVEVRYAMFSTRAEGTITGTEIKTVRTRRSSHEVLSLSFQYPNESGQSVTARQEVDLNAPFKTGDSVTVYHFRGDDPRARLKGTGRTWPVILLLASLLFTGVWVWRTAQEANQPISSKPRARRQTRLQAR